MKRFMMITVALVGLTMATSSVANADHWHGRRGGSGFGISISYGSGFNNFDRGFNRGFNRGFDRGFHRHHPVGFGGYPVYRPVPVYSVPVYSVPVYGGFGGFHGSRRCR